MNKVTINYDTVTVSASEEGADAEQVYDAMRSAFSALGFTSDVTDDYMPAR